MRIKIQEHGPYHVTGGIPIHEKVITPHGHHYTYEEGRVLPQTDDYYLCRCGHSKNAPFCDGNHEACHFRGTEVASRRPYKERIEDVVEGKTMTLLDDGRCAFARFCHRDEGDIWTLTEEDSDPESRKEAITAASMCPAGRLVMIDKSLHVLEEDNEPEIIILQDPQESASAGIFVKGNITVEAADGTEYEVRNRMALCRCGHSKNMPFCDASHVNYSFDDGDL